MNVVPSVVSERLRDALRFLPSALARVNRNVAVWKEWSQKEKFAIIANQFSSPPDLLLAEGLKREAIPVFNIEHGVGAGLDMHHQAYTDTGYENRSAMRVFFNAAQKGQLEDECNGSNAKDCIVGAPQIFERIRFKPLRRRLVRRHLGVREHLMCWVTGLYPNNMQRQPHYFLDGPYHELRREITYDILANIPYEILLKLYPTMRYSDGDPFNDIMDLPANIHPEMLIDFRNFRAAADLILTDEPGNALAWCWGLDIPLIYIDTQMPLLNEVGAAFSDTDFY